jgi:transcriptional regulator with GAF, ATPase, and Fis domain
LENIVERALIRSSANPGEKYLHFGEPDRSSGQNVAAPAVSLATLPVLRMDAAMKSHIESVLDLTNGKIQGDHGAASLLGLPPSTLRNRMRKLRVIYGKARKDR